MNKYITFPSNFNTYLKRINVILCNVGIYLLLESEKKAAELKNSLKIPVFRVIENHDEDITG